MFLVQAQIRPGGLSTGRFLGVVRTRRERRLLPHQLPTNGDRRRRDSQDRVIVVGRHGLGRRRPRPCSDSCICTTWKVDSEMKHRPPWLTSTRSRSKANKKFQRFFRNHPFWGTPPDRSGSLRINQNHIRRLWRPLVFVFRNPRCIAHLAD